MSYIQWLKPEDVEYSPSRRYVFGRGMNDSWHLINTETDIDYCKSDSNIDYYTVFYEVKNGLFDDISSDRLPSEEQLKIWELHDQEIQADLVEQANYLATTFYDVCVSTELPMCDREDVKTLILNYFVNKAIYFYNTVLYELKERCRRKFQYKKWEQEATTKKDKQLYRSMCGRYW